MRDGDEDHEGSARSHGPAARAEGGPELEGGQGPAAGRTDAFYRRLVDNTLDMIAVLDVEGRVVFNSPAIKTFLGYEPGELNGRFAFDLIHPDDRVALLEMFGSESRVSGAVEYFEYRFPHKDGSWRFLESIAANLLDDPTVNGVMVTSRDITERKRVEEELRDSEEMHRTLVGISPDVITVTDLNGRITYISQQVLSMHGYESTEDLLGKNVLIFIDPREHERAIAVWRRALDEGEVRNVEFLAVRKDGGRFVTELNGALIRDSRGRPKSLVAFTRDITERKQMEKELRDRNEELEAFAYTISHDLLSPVAIVEGYAKAALEADAEGRAEAERECLEAIARGAKRMNDLISSLLQYAQAGHVDPEPHGVNPEEVLVEVFMDLEEEMRERTPRFESDADMPRIRASAVKLRQVFGNLIGNALKHMGDVPDPMVRVSVEEQGGAAVFCVRDNGVGIPQELHQKVFEPFQRFSLAETRGLGIGLSTVRRAVEAWGGRVWVESIPGEGACFFFTAPLAE